MVDDDRLNRRKYTRHELEQYAERFRAWGRWGDDDELGAANHITPERVVDAARLVRRGVVIPLAVPLDKHGPQSGPRARANPQHVMLRVPSDEPFDAAGLQGGADDAIYLPLQAGTQWDAFAHFFHAGYGYNGRGTETVTAAGGARFNSITEFAPRSVTRGVLLDVARHLGRDWLDPGEAIQADELAACARDQGVEVGSGDIVLVRTGHLERRRAEGSWGDFAGGPAPGLGVSAAEFLVPLGVAGVAVDTWAAEVMPFETDDLICPLHIVLLVNAGVLIGEIWDLAELARDCAEHGVYEFLLTSVPLLVTGAVGSPLTPLAVL